MSPNITPFVVLLAVCVASVLSQRQRDSGCYNNGIYYAHEREFSLPGQSQCLRYICWHGEISLREEGCEVNNQCHRVSSHFEHNCVRYYCNKTNTGSFFYYRPEIISLRCRDANNRCRSPGDYFPFNMNGRFYPRCTCTVVSQERINYRCVTTTNPRLVPAGNRQGQGYQSRRQGQGYYPDPRSGRNQGNNQAPRDLSGGGQMGGRRSRYETRTYSRRTEHSGYSNK